MRTVDDDRRVTMALLDRELVHREELEAVKVRRSEPVLKRGFVEILHSVPAQPVERCDVLDGELLAKPHDALGESTGDSSVAVQPWQAFQARTASRTLNTASGDTEVGLSVEDGQVADHTLGDVVHGDGPVAACIARHRPVEDGLQLDPYPGSAAIAAGFIALCSYD